MEEVQARPAEHSGQPGASLSASTSSQSSAQPSSSRQFAQSFDRSRRPATAKAVQHLCAHSAYATLGTTLPPTDYPAMRHGT